MSPEIFCTAIVQVMGVDICVIPRAPTLPYTYVPPTRVTFLVLAGVKMSPGLSDGANITLQKCKTTTQPSFAL